jgi:hypothetical protein
MDELKHSGVDCTLRPEEIETIKNLIQPALASLFNEAGIQWEMTLNEQDRLWSVDIKTKK